MSAPTETQPSMCLYEESAVMIVCVDCVDGECVWTVGVNSVCVGCVVGLCLCLDKDWGEAKHSGSVHASRHSCAGFDSWRSRNFSMLLRLVSGQQRLDNVNRTHLVQASGSPVLQKNTLDKEMRRKAAPRVGSGSKGHIRVTLG